MRCPNTTRLRRVDAIGGLQGHAAALSRHLDQAGVVQTIVTAQLPAARGARPFGLHGVRHRVGLEAPAPRQGYAAACAPRLRRLSGSVDLVHVHLGEDLAVLPLGHAVAALRGIPLVVTVHHSNRYTMRGGHPRALLLRGVGGSSERQILPKARAVITLTASLADRLRAAGVATERIHVIASGVDPSLFQPAYPDPCRAVDRPRIVFVGRLAEQKGLLTLLRAIPLLRTPDTRVVLVGDGPQRAVLERAARSLGVADRVVFAGPLPHERVPAVLQHADVLVLPSRYEELGSVVLEAMHASVPVVASRVGGIPSLVEDGVSGVLVPPGDPSALARAVDRVLTEPLLARRLVAGGVRVAASHRWDRLAPQVLEVYRGVLDRAWDHPSRGALMLAVAPSRPA